MSKFVELLQGGELDRLDLEARNGLILGKVN
jgi:hypothetical protein